MRREYKGAAQASVLTSALGNSTANLTIYCNDLTNWPTGVSNRPFYVVIDRGKANEEKILCSSRSSNTLTVFNDGVTNGRAADGTPISSHSINAVIEHVFTATDADEANSHVNTTGVHITTSQRGVTICTSSTRPASPGTSEVILETDTLMLKVWDGSGWDNVTSGSGGYPDLFLLMGA